jgi:hypothetical protein
MCALRQHRKQNRKGAKTQRYAKEIVPARAASDSRATPALTIPALTGRAPSSPAQAGEEIGNRNFHGLLVFPSALS